MRPQSGHGSTSPGAAPQHPAREQRRPARVGDQGIAANSPGGWPYERQPRKLAWTRLGQGQQLLSRPERPYSATPGLPPDWAAPAASGEPRAGGLGTVVHSASLPEPALSQP